MARALPAREVSAWSFSVIEPLEMKSRNDK
jgi:hypothetical protein